MSFLKNEIGEQEGRTGPVSGRTQWYQWEGGECRKRV
jgi:hypothetical protein